MRYDRSARAVHRRAVLLGAVVLAALGALGAPAAAAAELEPATLQPFTDRLGGPASAPQTVTLTSESGGFVGQATVEGPGFAIVDDQCIGRRLAPSDDATPPSGTVSSCTVTVTFTAIDVGETRGRLVIPVSPEGDASVGLVGLGTGPRVIVDPAEGRAFSTPVGTASAAQRIILTNTGNEPLESMVATAGPNFAIVTDTCTGATLAPSGATSSCVMDVVFTPTAVTTYETTLRISSNDPVRPTVDVPLIGSGTPVAAVAPPPGAVSEPLAPGSANGDTDADGVPDSADSCRSTAGDLQNGCPSELNAEIRERWRVTTRGSQLVALVVRAPTGSRIELRCTARRGVCGVSKRIIARTTTRTTGLTRYFKRSRIMPALTMISVRVTRPRQIGVYERHVTRTKQRLPKVTQRCIRAGTVQPCT